MTDDATVPVKVVDLETVAAVLEAYGSDEALPLVRSYIPKPRLVIVDLDELKAIADRNTPVSLYSEVYRLIARLEAQK